MSAIRILIADDHEIVREGLRGMLSTQPDFEVVGLAADGEEAVSLALDLRPDVIVMDLEMPRLDGVEAIRRIRERLPDSRVLVLTAYDTDERIIDAVRAGARGYLLKGLPRQELFQGIRIVHEGGSLLQPTIATRLMSRVDQLLRNGGQAAATTPSGTPDREAASISAGTPTEGAASSGNATFLFTDVRGFTALTSRVGDEAADALLARHQALVRDLIAGHAGRVVKSTGDGFMCVFMSTRQALRAAVRIQAAIAEQAQGDHHLEVGIGIDVGEANVRDGDYIGSAVNLAARLCSRARAGQIAVSDAVRHVVRVVEGARYRDLGWQSIKGYPQEEHIYLLDWRPAADIGAPAPAPATAAEAPADRAEAEPAPAEAAVERPPLIGRSPELERLRQELALAIAGAGRTVLIAGEAGIGKSFLAGELLEEARAQGARILIGRSYEGTPAPYLPFIEALRQSVRDIPAPEVERLAGSAAPELAKLLPELAYALPHLQAGPKLPPQEEQLRMWEGLAQLAERSSRDRPTVMLLEDIQWADRASLDLLQYLARNTRSYRVLLVATYRDTDLDWQQPWTEIATGMVREHVATCFTLRRLDEAETRALALSMLQTDDAPESFIRLLHHTTQGTPYHIEEVLRSLVEQGTLVRETEPAPDAPARWRFGNVTELRLPQSIRQLVAQRLRALPVETVEALRAAAVIGPAFAFEVLQSVTARDEEALIAAIEQATRARLVEAVGESDEDSYRFTHHAVQQTLYEVLIPRRRRRLHARVAAALERLYAGRLDEHLGEIARHLAEADDRPRAVAFSVKAAERAGRLFAHAEAATFYERALSLLDEADTERRALLTERLGVAYWLHGDGPAAESAFSRALDLREARGEIVAAARIERRIGLVHHRLLLDFAGGDAFLQRARARVEGMPDEPELARVWIDLARARAFEGQGGEARRYAEQGLALAERVGSSEDVLSALLELGLGNFTLGRWAEFDAAYDRARQLAEAAHDLTALARIATNVAAAAGMRGHLDDAIAGRLEGLRLMEEAGNLGAMWYPAAYTSLMAWVAGRWEQAAGLGQRAIDLAERAGQGMMPLDWTLHLAHGDWPAAIASISAAVPIAEARRDRQSLALMLQQLSDLSLWLDDYAAAERHAREGLRLFEELDYPLMRLGFLPRLAEVLALTGRDEEALDLAHEGGRQAARLDVPEEVARAERAMALVLARRGQAALARRTFDAAAATLTRLRHPYETARTLELAARHLPPDAEPPAARRDRLTRALAAYESLPAPLEVARLQALLSGE